MKAAVHDAIAEIREHFPDSPLTVTEDREGGAAVIVEKVYFTGDVYTQGNTWVGFRINFQYPLPDIYPHYVRGDLARKDGKPLGEATSVCAFEGRQAIQLSRRSNSRNPANETALLKLLKVLKWLETRA